MGDAVSIASKLKDVAPAGHVWVGPETHRATAGRLRVRAGAAPRRARAVVGLARSDAGAGLPHASRPGRDDLRGARRARRGARDAAARARRASRSGRAASPGVVGDAGLGKSRLLDRARRERRGTRRPLGGGPLGGTRPQPAFPSVRRPAALAARRRRPGALRDLGGPRALSRPFLGAETEELPAVARDDRGRAAAAGRSRAHGRGPSGDHRSPVSARDRDALSRRRARATAGALLRGSLLGRPRLDRAARGAPAARRRRAGALPLRRASRLPGDDGPHRDGGRAACSPADRVAPHRPAAPRRRRHDEAPRHALPSRGAAARLARAHRRARRRQPALRRGAPALADRAGRGRGDRRRSAARPPRSSRWWCRRPSRRSSSRASITCGRARSRCCRSRPWSASASPSRCSPISSSSPRRCRRCSTTLVEAQLLLERDPRRATARSPSSTA